MDRRIKYYGIQAVAFFISTLVLIIALVVGSGWGIWCFALPVCVGVGGLGWWLSRKFRVETSRHLTPREWEELRGALEDVPVMSVLHLFKQDRKRLEKFRYLPLLEQSLWESLAEDDIDVARVVRIAFLLHTFNRDLSEFADVFPIVPDPVVSAYLMDIAAERGRLVHRAHLSQVVDTIPLLIGELGHGMPGVDEPNDDPGQNAAWRLLLFGPLAYQQLHAAQDHADPRVREAILAMLMLQDAWPSRTSDLQRRLMRDDDPVVRRAALELLAFDGEQNLGVIRRVAQDPDLGKRARELVLELGGGEAPRSTPPGSQGRRPPQRG